MAKALGEGEGTTTTARATDAGTAREALRRPGSLDFRRRTPAPTRAQLPHSLARDDRRVGWDEVGDGARRAFDPSTLPD